MKFELRKKAQKFLDKLEPKQRARILFAINKIPEGDIKQLRGELGFRLRVGDFRVVYDIADDKIIVYEVGNRGDVYK